jgi:hypothetical protein
MQKINSHIHIQPAPVKSSDMSSQQHSQITAFVKRSCMKVFHDAKSRSSEETMLTLDVVTDELRNFILSV